MTMTPAAPPPRELGSIGSFVDDRIRTLQHGLVSRQRSQHAGALAALARLRRAAGKPVGTEIDALEFALPEHLSTSMDDAVTAEEDAAHLALTLYATHQQSKTGAMHLRGQDLGSALRLLDTGLTAEPVRQRFRRLGTADSFPELSYHLRGVVALLRARSAPLDYGRLADELVAWQGEQRSKVQLAWGRGFYRSARPTSSASSPAAPSSHTEET